MYAKQCSQSSNAQSKTHPVHIIRRSLDAIKYHAYTLHLFTCSDIKSIIVPSVLFAVLTGIPIVESQYNASRFEASLFAISRIPQVLIWVWFVLLCFVVGNQSSVESVEEDSFNKPWRPLPAGRLSAEQARFLYIATYPLAFTASLFVGGTVPCLALFALTIMYNEFDGGKYWVSRNLLNAAGITTFAAGALEVLIGSAPQKTLYTWFAILGAVIGTSIHLQDLYDQEGDAKIGRRTIPLIFGDLATRCNIAVTLPFWSVACPMFWQASAAGYVLPVALGLLIPARSLTKRSAKDDRKSFKLYNTWLISMYLLPLFGTITLV